MARAAMTAKARPEATASVTIAAPSRSTMPDGATVGAERHAHAGLARSLRRGEADECVDAGRVENERDDRERRHDGHAESLPDDGGGDHSFEASDVVERLQGVDGPHRGLGGVDEQLRIAA